MSDANPGRFTSIPTAEFIPCNLYPIALNSKSLKGVAEGGLISDIYNGTKSGNFGWLSWTGNSSAPALASSLTPPGNSNTYINPHNPLDREVSAGDWVRGNPGVSNSKNVRDALEALKARDIIVPVWNEARGQGSNTLYRVETFAQVRLLSYQLPEQNRISARFLGYTECPVPVNKAPQVNAGPDQTVTLPAAVSLNGTVTDDGLPRGIALTLSWTKVSGPGSVIFSTASKAATTASFSTAGVYVLRLTASDSQLSSNDEVTIIVNPANQQPTVNAGPNQTITLPDAAQLNGAATDDGLPAGSTLTTLWSQVSGPGSVSFDKPNSTATTAAFSVPGTYVLRLTASDSALTSSDEITVTVNSNPARSRVYTLNADFDEGSAINVVHSLPDQLQLNNTTRAFGFIWVAVSTKGTIVKINTETGVVLGEYYTSPHAEPRNPSRTTVDHNGNVWATNRDGNSVVQIGLIENGQCVDRNGNGLIDTSTGLNDLRPWSNVGPISDTNGGVSTAEDECIIRYKRVSSYGTRHVSVDRNNDVWVSGLTSGTSSTQIFDLIDGRTGLIKRTEGPVGYGGYGGLIDKDGVIWSARQLLRWNTSKPLTGPNGVNWVGYNHDSYGLCIDSQGNVWNTQLVGARVNKFAPDGTLLGSFQHGGYYAQGCVVGRNDDVWIAHSLHDATVGHLKNDGTFVGNVNVSSGPTGVAVDALGKIWSTNYDSGNVSRIDPNAGPIGADGVTRVGESNFTTVYLGGNLYNYSDMTGSTLTGAPNSGTWSTIFDSEKAGAEWGRIGWSARVCGDAALSISVASSEDGTTFGQSETVTNGADPGVGQGRYLKITVSFKRAASGESPVLYDLSVGTQGFTLPSPVNAAPEVNAGTDQTIALPNVATLQGSACDDGWPTGSPLTFSWSLVSGPGSVTFADAAKASTAASFSVAGTYMLRLTASDSQFNGSDDVTINVGVANQAPVVNAGSDRTVAPCRGGSARGNIIVNHDEWSLSDTGFNSSPDAARFSQNLGCFFTGGKPGKFLVYSSNYGLTDGQLAATMIGAGQTWTVSRSVEFSLPNLLQYDAVFVGGDAADNAVLIDYVKAGGNVYLALATGIGGAVSEAARWNTFLNAFNLNAASDYNLLSGALPISSQHPVFDGVKVLYYGNGQSVNKLDATDTHSDIPETYLGHGLFGIYQTDLTVKSLDNVTIQLNGTASDDGLPAGSTLVNFWSKLSGPGEVAFGNSNQAATTATFNVPGTYVLRLGVSDSELTGSDEIQIIVNLGNQAPSVNAGSDQAVTLPGSVSLSGTVADDGLPDGSTLTTSWRQVSGPGVATFASPNAAVTTAAFSMPGTYLLRLTANDSQFSTSDDVSIVVNPEEGTNQRPTVSAGADQTITQTDSVSLNGTASDDGLPAGSALSLTWSKVEGPGSVSFSNPQSAATTANFGSAGRYVLRLTVNDSELSAADDVVIIVNAANNQAPTVSAGPDQTVTLPQTADLQGAVTDDGLPAGSTLTLTWSMVSGPGSVIFASGSGGPAMATASFSEAGTYVLRLTANDSALTGSDDVTVTVNEGAPAPAASLISPVDGSEITKRANVIGSVSNGNWKLEYSLNTNDGSAAQSWILLASGSAPVTHGVLGTFDPSLLLNGIYAIRLTAADAGGRTAAASTSVVVRGEQKIGNFTISFNDLSVAVAGLPIEVIRTYDSRDKRVGDFGVGWRLGIRNVRVEKTGILGQHWEVTSSGGNFPTYCVRPTRPRLVTLTFPTGKVYKFQAVPDPQCQFAGVNRFPTVGFAPLPGTQGSLVSLNDNEVFLPGGAVGETELRLLEDQSLYNPTLFKLTTEDGAAYVVDQNLGVRSVMDTNGNTLTVNSDGIIHSSGKSISFTRDAQGRITRITDPSGHSMSYTYDANGDLVSFSDRENNVSRYTYNMTHGLLTILDPRGVQPLRNDYDADGRLIKQTDAFGNIITFTHDLDAQREITRDRLGNLTIYEYDANGNVLKITDAKGGVTARTYDARDNLLTETNALGHRTSYTYDTQDNRLTETNALGNTTVYTYNSRKQVLTITDPAGGVTTNTYDANGNLLSTSDPLGNLTTSVYSANGLPTSTKDAFGNTATFEYDASGNLLKETDQLGNSTVFSFDANGNKLTESVKRTNAAGAVETLTTVYHYDNLSRLVKVTYTDGSTTETIYNSVGKQGLIIDQLGRRTSYDYDDMGRLIRTTYPNDRKGEAQYDAEGRRTKSIDRAGRATLYTYDALGRLEKVVYADNSSTTTSYDLLGQAVSVTDERGHPTHYEYDSAGRRTKITDALAHVTTFTYDKNNNQTSVTDAKGQKTSYEYDAGNRRTRTLYPDGTSDSTAYNARGQAVGKTDQAGGTTQFEYDARGKLIKVTDALGGVTRYTYDEVGNQLTQRDANDHTTNYEYDRAGRRTRRNLPLGMSEVYAYDAAGNLTSRTDYLGKTTTFAYDVMNRLSRKIPDASLGQSPVIFSYTHTGRRLSMTDGTGSTTYLYDARDRLTSQAAPQGKLGYTYDAAGNLLSVRSEHANGTSVDYTYDALNRLSTIRDQRLTTGTTTYTYDVNGNLESTVYPNWVNTSYTYNKLNRLTELNTTKGTTIARYTYTLGAAGNRRSVIEASGRTVNYTYDSLYRLTGETITGDAATNGTVSYSYDAVGNRLSRNSTVPGVSSTTSTYDANDRLTDDSYDANGNTTNSGGSAYQYDFENRLTSLNGGAVTYTYNGDGNRVAKTVGGITTHFLVDTNNLTGHAQVIEEIIAGNVQRTYTYGHDLISQNQLIGGNWTSSFYGYDGHGSVRYLTDTDGTITDTYTYDAFGNLIAQTGTTPNDYLYTGEQHDANLGSYYLRARYYRPAIGRFLTSDRFPVLISDPLTLHRYNYVMNNAVNFVDPSGKFGTLAEVFTVESLMRVQMVSPLQITFLLAKGAAIASGMPFMNIGFRKQQWALNAMTENPDSMEEALRVYKEGSKLIEVGASFSHKLASAVDNVELPISGSYSLVTSLRRLNSISSPSSFAESLSALEVKAAYADKELMALYKAAFIHKDINITTLRFRIDRLMTEITLIEKIYFKLLQKVIAENHEEGN